MDLHLLAPSFVHDKFWVHDYAAVVSPFAPCKPENQEEGGQGDDATGCGADARIFHRLCEGV